MQNTKRALSPAYLLFISVFYSVAFAAETSRPITVDDLLRVPRVADVQLSPDGHHVAYTIATPNVATNETESNLWIVDTRKGAATQVTFTGKDRAARWSPDGTQLAFLSRRDGKAQLYLLPVSGGEARLITHMPVDLETHRWAPDGRTIVASAVVDSSCSSDDCLKVGAERRAAGKTVRIYERLPVRKAMQWVDGFRSHLFVIAVDGSVAPRDLTPGDELDVPSRLSIDGSIEASDIVVSPDSKQVCFSAEAGHEPDGQSFVQLFLVPLEGGAPRQLTSGATNNRTPAYSPDGKFIAYRSQHDGKNFGGEWRLILHDIAAGVGSDRTAGFDRSVGAIAWTAGGRALYLSAENETLSPLYRLTIADSAAPALVASGFIGEFSAAAGTTSVAFARSSLSAPAEIYFSTDGKVAPRQLTHHADSAMSGIDMPVAETISFKSPDATSVQAIYVPPAHLNWQRKYPLLVLLHGGPETMWGASWTYRWNAQVFAAAGFGVVMINRRGSTGYGQKFTAGVVQAWGGPAYEDIISGVDATLRRYGYLDAERVVAAGASYGGYMADWLATHTGRFKGIVSHSGVFNLTSMYATDVSEFLEFEQGGAPWSAAEIFAKWSPSTYAAALGKFKTPMLLTTGDRDFRVPYEQSLEMYASLQRQGVESKLVVFPEEGHWILKPQNSKLWYTTVIEWLGRRVGN